MIFTIRFNEILKAQKTKQSDLANYCHITRQSIFDFKVGKSVPSIETLYNICKYLDVSADYLLGLSEI